MAATNKNKLAKLNADIDRLVTVLECVTQEIVDFGYTTGRCACLGRYQDELASKRNQKLNLLNR